LAKASARDARRRVLARAVDGTVLGQSVRSEEGFRIEHIDPPRDGLEQPSFEQQAEALDIELLLSSEGYLLRSGALRSTYKLDADGAYEAAGPSGEGIRRVRLTPTHLELHASSRHSEGIAAVERSVPKSERMRGAAPPTLEGDVLDDTVPQLPEGSSVGAAPEEGVMPVELSAGKPSASMPVGDDLPLLLSIERRSGLSALGLLLLSRDELPPWVRLVLAVHVSLPDPDLQRLAGGQAAHQ
jgi:hypothetical protein